MRKWVEIGLLALALLGRPAPLLAEGSKPEAAARGREIYEHGVAADGAQIKCVTGPENAEVPAAILKCVSCHNDDGRGRAEGGVNPTNIRWNELTKPYSVRQPGGRERPPYTERLLIRALTTGLDANGNRLNPIMPRYRLTHEQASDLVAYLKALEGEPDPGVEDDSITVGIVLPPESTRGGMGRAIRETLTAAFDALNRDGGVYGRKIFCRFATAPEQNSVSAFEAFIEREQPFALLLSYIAGNEEEIAAIIQRRRIPVIQPVTLSTGFRPRSMRYVFYLSSGIEGQCAALIKFAMERPEMAGAQSLFIIHDGLADQFGGDLAKARVPEGVSLRVIKTAEIGDWASFLLQTKPNAVVWLATGTALRDFLIGAERAKSYPLLLAPGALAGQQIYEAAGGFDKRIFLSFPMLPADQSAEGRAEFHRLAETGGFSEGDLATRLSALSAAKLLIEALRKTGHEVTREKLVTMCEQFYALNLKQMRPVSFGADRRVGTTGAHVVGVDLQTRSLALRSQWVECDVR